MWDRDKKIARHNSGRKIKPTGYIYLPESNVFEAEGNLMTRICLQDAVINSAPRIGKYINKLELYRQYPPRKVKDKKMSEIENTSCVKNVMRVSSVYGIEIEPWGVAIILRRVNYGVYICTC